MCLIQSLHTQRIKLAHFQLGDFLPLDTGCEHRLYFTLLLNRRVGVPVCRMLLTGRRANSGVNDYIDDVFVKQLNTTSQGRKYLKKN